MDRKSKREHDSAVKDTRQQELELGLPRDKSKVGSKGATPQSRIALVQYVLISVLQLVVERSDLSPPERARVLSLMAMMETGEPVSSKWVDAIARDRELDNV